MSEKQEVDLGDQDARTSHKLVGRQSLRLLVNFGKFRNPLPDLYSHPHRSRYRCGEDPGSRLVVESPQAIRLVRRSALTALAQSDAPMRARGAGAPVALEGRAST